MASADRPRLNGAGDDAPPAVAAVVVNFNAGDALARCVESVLAQKLGVRLVVVDNASSDGSADRVGELYGRRDDVRVLRNDDNPGFARAVNQGAADPACRDARYLLILNPDCEFMPGALRSLLAALEANPKAGLAGPLVVDRDGPHPGGAEVETEIALRGGRWECLGSSHRPYARRPRWYRSRHAH
mgnify:CR=1 FL=1